MRHHSLRRSLAFLLLLGVGITALVLASPPSGAQDDGADCAGVRSGSVCIIQGQPPVEVAGQCPISGVVVFQDGFCFVLLAPDYLAPSPCPAPYAAQDALNGLPRACISVNALGDPAFECPAVPAGTTVQIELASADPYLVAQCVVLGEARCPDGTLPAPAPDDADCRVPIDLSDGTSLVCRQRGYFPATADVCVRETLATGIDATCAQGTRSLLGCLEPQSPLSRMQTACPESGLVFFTDGECYTLRPRVDGECEDGTTPDPLSLLCRQPVAVRPGAIVCAPGFERVPNRGCERWTAADGVPSYDCDGVDSGDAACENRVLVNYGVGAPLAVDQRVTVQYYGCPSTPDQAPRAASISVFDETTGLRILQGRAAPNRYIISRYSSSFQLPPASEQRIEFEVNCSDGTTETASTTISLGALTCNGLEATIDMNLGASGIGTSGDDVIIGTPGPDVIQAGDGNDTICALGGDDSVRGGLGQDTIFGGDDDDILFGGQDANIIDGGPGDDTIQGGGADDQLDGSFGHDVIRGGFGNDTIMGGFGFDILHGNDGDDMLDGGANDDRIFGYAGEDTINGGDGNDRLHGNRGDDRINGGPGDDIIWGNSGDDLANGDEDDDVLWGGPGLDFLSGAMGDDIIHGNDGDDSLLGGQGSDVIFGYAGDDSILGGPQDDVLHGNRGNDRIDGGEDNDRIFGYADNDRLLGGAGNDVIRGNFGDDDLDGGLGNDELWGSAGADTLAGNGGDDMLNGNSGPDALTGGAGTDVCDGGIGADTASTCETELRIP